MRFQNGFGPIVTILKRKKVMHLTHHQSLSKSQKICRIRVSSFYYIVMYLLKLNRKLFGLVSNLFFKRSRYTFSYLPIQELFCGRASFFGVFRGKNIPLIVPALDCRSDAGSALGTSKASRRLTFLAPLQQLLGMR